MDGGVVEVCHPKNEYFHLYVLQPWGRFLWRPVSQSWSTKKRWTGLTSQKTAGGVHGGAAEGPARRCEGWCRWCLVMPQGRRFLSSLRCRYQQKLGFGRGNGSKLSVLCAWVILDRHREKGLYTACVKVRKTAQWTLWCWSDVDKTTCKNFENLLKRRQLKHCD